ncbi:MAG TPA: hypothetical protein VF840_00385 [Terriglobales bacterium]
MSTAPQNKNNIRVFYDLRLFKSFPQRWIIGQASVLVTPKTVNLSAGGADSRKRAQPSRGARAMLPQLVQVRRMRTLCFSSEKNLEHFAHAIKFGDFEFHHPGTRYSRLETRITRYFASPACAENQSGIEYAAKFFRGDSVQHLP